MTRKMTLQAKATTTTDAGEFVALAAAYSIDRAGDRIVPGAFKASIDRWQASGKSVPLHWNHQGEPEDIIGAIDPATMEETELGLKVAGKVDLDGSEKGREAWRSMKAGTMSLSFGYMVVAEKQADDANELHELDLFEISVVPGPANADTRFLSLKSMSDDQLREELGSLRKRVDEIEAQLEDQPPDADDVEDEPGESQQASDPEADQFEVERLRALT